MPRSSDPVARLYDQFYAVVRRVPRGRVVTYGQVAELAGHPGASRAVGAAMRASTGRGLPWQRVVGKHARNLGRVAILDPVGGAIQRGLLEREGITFTPSGHIPLDRFGLKMKTARPGGRAVRGAGGRATTRPARRTSRGRRGPGA